MVVERTMMTQDIRWIQRLNSFIQALSHLQEAVALADLRPLSDLERQGLIHGFEFTHELAWNTLRDLLLDRGVQGLLGSRDTTREAFKVGLIGNGDAWMEMIRSRNLSSHTYNEATAIEIASAICGSYLAELTTLRATLEALLPETNS